MVNPFDWKAALLAKHAQHVVLIHFPIALCMTSVAFDFVAHWTRRGAASASRIGLHGALALAAYYNLFVAAVMTLPAVATGLLAWRWQLEGQRLKGNLLLHLVLGLLSAIMIWLVWWLHFRARRRSAESLPAYVLAIELAAMALVGLTAHLGGILSGVNA